MSLANRLSLYILVISLLIFGALSALILRYAAQREERLVSLYASVLVNSMVENINGEFADVEGIVRSTALLVMETWEDREKLRAVVRDMVKNNPTLAGGGVAFIPGEGASPGELDMEYIARDRDSSLVHKHLGDKSYDYAGMPWFTEPVRRKKGVWSEPYFDKGGGDVAMITYSLPVPDRHGRIFAVLTADMSLRLLEDELNAIKPIPSSFGLIITGKGQFAAHPDIGAMWNRDIFAYAEMLKSGDVRRLGEDMLAMRKGIAHIDIGGADLLAAYAPIPATGWSVCLVCPYTFMREAIGSILVAAGLIMLAGLVALTLMARIAIVHATRPLARLTMAANAISAGDLDAALPAMNARDELSRLNNAFAAMQCSLREQMRQLEINAGVQARIDSELGIARKIQLGMLPHKFSPFREADNLELYAMLKPARAVGGDLYDFFIRGNRLFFAIGDVSGKGIPAAMFMSMTRMAFRIASGTSDSPEHIVGAVNRAVARDNQECMFVTMFAGVLELDSGSLRFCNAGHNPPLLLAPDGGARFLKAKENLPLGIVEDFVFAGEEMRIAFGATLFFYTDGLSEAENPLHEQFGEERMLKASRECGAKTPRELVESFETKVKSFADGAEQSDDIAMLAWRLTDRGNMAPMTLRLTSSMSSLAGLLPFVDRATAALGLDSALKNNLTLALEEAIVNAINYAYPGNEDGEITLEADYGKEAHELIFRLTDRGAAFDPTAAPPADISSPVEERPIGGLGIFLIRSLVDSVTYRRSDGANTLEMKKRLGHTPEE